MGAFLGAGERDEPAGGRAGQAAGPQALGAFRFQPGQADQPGQQRNGLRRSQRRGGTGGALGVDPFPDHAGIGQGRLLDGLQHRHRVGVQRPALPGGQGRAVAQARLHRRGQHPGSSLLGQLQQPDHRGHEPLDLAARRAVTADEPGLEVLQQRRRHLPQPGRPAMPGFKAGSRETGERPQMPHHLLEIRAAGAHRPVVTADRCQCRGQRSHQPRAGQVRQVHHLPGPAEDDGEDDRADRRHRLRRLAGAADGIEAHLAAAGHAPAPAAEPSSPVNAAASAPAWASHRARAEATISCASSSTSR